MVFFESLRPYYFTSIRQVVKKLFRQRFLLIFVFRCVYSFFFFCGISARAKHNCVFNAKYQTLHLCDNKRTEMYICFYRSVTNLHPNSVSFFKKEKKIRTRDQNFLLLSLQITILINVVIFLAIFSLVFT